MTNRVFCFFQSLRQQIPVVNHAAKTPQDAQFGVTTQLIAI